MSTVSHVSVVASETVETIKYKLKINGVLKIIKNYDEIQIKLGDQLIIEDILSGTVDPSEYIVNFKGFVGNLMNNNGEDRGYIIDTSKKVLLKKYSLNKEGHLYQVLTTLNGKEVGKIFINIQSSTKET